MTKNDAGRDGPPGDRPVHPIGVVSARTGLTPDVIRVWERRYGVVEPARDEAGRRLYSDGDMERLSLLAQATSGGRGIGQVAELGVDELRALVRSDEAARWRAGRGGAREGGEAEATEVVERSLERTRALDGPGLESELRRAATLLGLSAFLDGVVAPLFRRIGEEWHAGRLSVAQEHLASGVAGALVASLSGSVAGAPGAPVLVVATPSGEHHEIGALLVAAAAGGEGWRVSYLGANVPAADIVGAASVTSARAVALSVVYAGAESAASEVAAVRAGLPSGVDVVVGGEAARRLGDQRGVRWLSDLPSLRSYLANGSGRLP